MKSTVLVQAKIAPEVKKSSEKILNDFGLDLSTAIRMFLIKVMQTRSIPFTIGYEEERQLEPSKEFAEYLRSVKKDIEQENNIINFSDNATALNYLKKLIK